MKPSSIQIEIYLEIGKKRAFASAIHWPGWCRSGRDEAAATQALFDYGPRYANVLHRAQIEFQAPVDSSIFVVVERITGGAGTDFGAPGKPPSSDADPVDAAELRRFQALLLAFWQAFDAAAQAAVGVELRKGPRGGGRDRDGILRHVLEADVAYLACIGRKLKTAGVEPHLELGQVRPVILDALAAAARGEVAPQGPRGGARWTPRFYVRYSAWHILDHAWELEDRMA